MARVKYPHRGGYGSSGLDRARAVRKKKPYKVVLEIVTEEKKKLRSVMAYNAAAPPGYTFVPLGNRDLTEYCKEKCRKGDLVAHIVSAKPRSKAPADAEKDSDTTQIDTRRIGHHFPDAIVDQACDYLGYRWDRRKGFVKDSEQTRLAQSLREYGNRMMLHGRPATETQTKEQIRNAILEVFPKIPESDLAAIVNHAFEEGTDRVGNAKDLTLARRVQLAVGAYIRHQYTDYDKMLKSDGCTWHEARAKAQSASYAKLKEWRDEGDGPELEDTFREIIVLDDDEDGESESSDDASDVDERQDSLEIFSSRATGRELQPETFAPVRRQDAHRMRSVYPAFSATHEPRHLIPARSQPFSQRVTPQTIAPQYEPPSYNWAPGRAKEPYVHVPATMGPLDFAHMSSLPTTTPPGTVVIDGRLHYLEPCSDPSPHSYASEKTPLYRPPPPQHRDAYVRAPPRVRLLYNTQPYRSAPPPASPRGSGEDAVLPSIEQDAEHISSPRRMNEAPNPQRNDGGSAAPHYRSMVPTDVNSPKRVAYGAPVREHAHELRESTREQVFQRSRPILHDMPGVSQSSQPSMFARLHTREGIHSQVPPRVQPARNVVDLTYSPLRPSHGDRDSYVASSSSRPPVVSSSRSYVQNSSREYSARIPEYRIIEGYPPRHESVYHREPRPLSYAEPDGSYTRSGLQYAHALH